MAYKKSVWLNPDSSASTGNVVAFDGEIVYKDGPYYSTFLSISDCNVSARLHKAEYESRENFINKMKLLNKSITEFIDYLENCE